MTCLSLSFLGREWHDRSRGFWILTALLVATRLGPLPWVAGMDPVGDEGAYISRGLALLQIISQWLGAGPIDPENVDRFYHFGWHPPLSAVLAGFSHALGGMPAARGLQALIGILGGLYFFRLASLLLSRRATLVAYGAYVANPYLIVFSHLLWSENVYLLLTTVWLIWYLGLLEQSRFSPAGAGLGGVLTGLLWYAKSAFTPVWLALLLVLPLVARRRGAAAGTYLAAGLSGLVLALPWNLLIHAQEGRVSFGSTAATVHVAAKYNTLGLTSWTKTWNLTRERAAANGGHFSDEAKKISAEYFRSLDFNPGPPLKIIARDTVKGYLLGRSFIERHLSWGIYPTTVPALGVGLLLLDHAARFLVVGLGALGLLLGRLSAAPRLILVTFALANAAIVLVGSPNGRHVLMNYPMLCLGLAALWQRLQGTRVRLAIGTTAALLLLGTALVDFGRRASPAWPYRFVEPMRVAGAAPRFASDVLMFKPAPGCAPQIPLEFDADTLRRIKIQDRHDQPRLRQPPGTRMVVKRPWLKVRLRQPAATAQRYLDFAVADASRHRIDLQTHPNRWEPVPGSCFTVRWIGHRLR